MVLAAGSDKNAEAARTRLCETYWYPLYAYLRHQGHSSTQSEDLTQAFFLKLLEKNCLSSATPQRGRFRSFLLTALKHFVANERDFESAQKRGGAMRFVSIDVPAAESKLSLATAESQTPEAIFERDWALTLIEKVRADLKRDWTRQGKAPLYSALRPFLANGAARPHAETAAQLGMSEGAIKVAVHRLRKQFRESLRNEIAATVDSEAEIDQELAFLLAALSR
jgi:DNA-directed RNA polymerase specialized sigma24 family protein